MLLECPVSPTRTSLSLIVMDLSAVLLARGLALLFWHAIKPEVGLDQDFGIWLTAVLFPLAFASFGLYAAKGFGAAEELRRVVLASVLVSLLLTTASFLTKDLSQGGYSRGIFLSSFLLVTLFIPLGRAALRHFCASQPWWGVPVLVLGAGTTGRLVIENLRQEPHVGFKPIACLDDDGTKRGTCAGIPIAGPLSLAPEIARALRIYHVLIAMPNLDREELVEVIERWGATFSHVVIIPNLFGIATLWVATRDLGGVLGLEVRRNLLIPLNRWIKRSLDVAMGIAFGLLALPVIAVAAAWVKIVSPGASPFYWQEREGENCKIMRVCKLRTMFPDAARLLEEHLERSPQARMEWKRYYKLKLDPRILPGIGKILRRTSLDELPQIWSVLKGDMSLVGPRPFPAYHLEQFSPEFRSLRSSVTPGLTGLWQVSARNDADLKAQESLDTYYIRNWSIWLDLHILARTVRAVVLAKGY